MRELGVAKTQIAWLAGFVGSFSRHRRDTLLAPGGIKKTGLKKAIWPITLIMNINILGLHCPLGGKTVPPDTSWDLADRLHSRL